MRRKKRKATPVDVSNPDPITKAIWVKQIKKMVANGYLPQSLAKVYGTALIAEVVYGITPALVEERIMSLLNDDANAGLEKRTAELNRQDALPAGFSLTASNKDNTAEIKKLD